MAAKAFKSLIHGGGVAAIFSSCAVHKLSLTAPKPRRIRHFAQILLQGTVATRPRHISTIGASRAAETEPNPMEEAFSKYESCLHDLNDKRRKVWKASYDIKERSRLVMYKVEGISKHDKDEILKQAGKDLSVIVDRDMSRLVKELQGTDFWMLGQDYSHGIQMYVGAATLCYFCKTGALLNLDEINATLRPLSDSPIELLKISVYDYLIGLANMNEGLLQLATQQIEDDELEFAKKIYMFVHEIEYERQCIACFDSADMLMKYDTITEGLTKVENDFVSACVSRREFLRLLRA